MESIARLRSASRAGYRVRWREEDPSSRWSSARAYARNPKRLSRQSSSKVLPPTGFLGKEPRNDGMDPRPLICGLAMGQECSVTFKTARRVRDGSYNDWNRFGKERVRSVRGG